MINAALHERMELQRRAAGLVDGRHYTTFVAEVKALRKAGDDDAAAGILIRLIEAVEREVAAPLPGHGHVPAWYFDQLATIYRKAGRDDAAALVRQRLMIATVKAETGALLAAKAVQAPDAIPAIKPNPAAVAAGRWLGRMFAATKKAMHS